MRPASAPDGGAGDQARDGLAARLVEVRALASEMLAPVGRHEAEALPLPILAREHQAAPHVRDYLIWWTLNANATGTFAARTRWLRRLPAPWLLRMMFALGYDGLVYIQDGAAIGHVFFQRRGDALHGFSTAVSPPFDGGGYSVAILLDFIAYASQAPGIVKARVGRGDNNVTRRFLQRLEGLAPALGWKISPAGWITVHAGRDAER